MIKSGERGRFIPPLLHVANKQPVLFQSTLQRTLFSRNWKISWRYWILDSFNSFHTNIFHAFNLGLCGNAPRDAEMRPRHPAFVAHRKKNTLYFSKISFQNAQNRDVPKISWRSPASRVRLRVRISFNENKALNLNSHANTEMRTCGHAAALPLFSCTSQKNVG